MDGKDLMALVYVSSATGRLSADQIDGILASSRRVNAQCDVTGALLHHDGSFLQYLEGPQPGLDRVWQRVVTCRLHHGINPLVREPVAHRHFDSWHMGFAEAPASVLQTLSQSRWRSTAGTLLNAQDPSSALALLIDFWRRAKGF